MSHGDLDSERIATVLALPAVRLDDEEHGARCARFAATLFDRVAPALDLPSNCRDLAVDAALLHDIGYQRSARDHHRKAYDIILELDLPGLDDRQRQIVACVARYHGGAYPNIEHAGFGEMSPDDQRLVRRLVAVVRLAAALDASHRGAVSRVEVWTSDETIVLTAHSFDEPAIERDRLRENEGAFRHLTQRSLVTLVETASD